VELGEHAAEGGEVAAGFELQLLEQQVGLAAGGAARERLR